MKIYHLLGWLIVFLLGVGWELVARAELISALFLPPLSAVLWTFWMLTLDGTLPANMLESMRNMFIGYGLAVLVAVPLGVFMGYSRAVFNLFDPAIELIRPLPATAVVPLAILFLGIGPAEKIFVVFFTCVRIIMVNAMYGARSVDPVLLETARSYGYSGFRLVRRIILPAAMPQIVTGMRISVPIAIVVIVAAEMLASDKGLGFFISLSQRTYATPEMYSGVVLLCIIGYVLNWLLQMIERRLLAYHHESKQFMR